MASKMNDKKLDRTFEKKVKHVQKHNGIHVFWDKEGVWKRIQQALAESGSGPKMIAWYTAMAASVSFLVASTANILNYDIFSAPVEEPMAISVQEETMQQSDPVLQVTRSAMPADSMIIPMRSRTASLLSEGLQIEAAEQIKPSNPRVNLVRTEGSGLVRYTSNPALKAKIAGGISLNSQFFSPKVDIGVVLNLSPKQSDVKRSVFVGSSVQLMNRIGSEQSTSQGLSTGYFVKSAFETEKMKNGKLRSWSTGAEYLIHSSDDSVSRNMLRIFYNRSIMGRLKIGPEIMFTRSFKKVYPGITLALG